jgi:hypothetical protein
VDLSDAASRGRARRDPSAIAHDHDVREARHDRPRRRLRRNHDVHDAHDAHDTDDEPLPSLVQEADRGGVVNVVRVVVPAKRAGRKGSR